MSPSLLVIWLCKFCPVVCKLLLVVFKEPLRESTSVSLAATLPLIDDTSEFRLPLIACMSLCRKEPVVFKFAAFWDILLELLSIVPLKLSISAALRAISPLKT